MRYTVVLLLLVVLSPSVLDAGWELFTNKNTINDILVDPVRGVVYLSSGGGLVEISPSPDTVITYKTTIEGLASTDLNCVSLDSSGNLLLGSATRGMTILFSDGEVRNYSTFDGLPSDEVLCVMAGDGDFWVGTTAGAVQMELEGKNVNRKSAIYFGDPFEYEVRDFSIDDTDVWFATSEGLWLLDGEELKSWSVGEGLLDVSVRDILAVSGDSLLIATDSGVQAFLPADGQFFDLSSGLSTSDAKQVRELSLLDGDLWTATAGGVFHYSTGSMTWVDETLDLSSRDVLSIAFDLSGVPLVGMERKGVARRREGGWESLEFPGPLVNSLDKVAVDERGVAWASSWSVSASQAGIFRYDGETVQNYTSDNSGLLYNLASSLTIAPDGAVWIGSPWYSSGGSGISVLHDGGTPDLDDDTWITKEGTVSGLSGDALRNGIVFKGSGEAWAASWNQEDYGLPGGLDVISYQDTTFTFRSFGELVEGRRIQAMAIDPQGDLWIGYINTGMDVFVLRPVTTGGDSLFFTIDPDGIYLAGETITDLEVDSKGHLWICTTSGVTELDYAGDPVNSSGFTWKSFTMDNSPLPDVQVNAVSFQGGRFVWFATPSGAALYDRELDKWEVYNQDNSPLPSENVKDVYVDENSTAVWFATEGGLVKFDLLGDEPGISQSGKVIVAPNPYLPGEDPRGVKLLMLKPGTGIDIFDISGKHVVHLDAQSDAVLWDARDSSGKNVASGVYLVVARSPDGTIGRGKIAIVR